MDKVGPQDVSENNAASIYAIRIEDIFLILKS